MGWKPPVELYSASDKSTFAYESTTKRWPRILTQIIDELNSHFDSCGGDKLKEAKQLINDIGVLKYEIMHDRTLPPLEEDGGANCALYNEELEALVNDGKKTWFQMPWLFAECYMYRRLRVMYAQTQHWKNYDIFARQKLATFASAGPGVYALALSVNDLILSNSSANESEDNTKAAFLELAQVALWGNATDLSLLQNLSHSDIQALQKTGKAAQKEAEHLILANNLDQAWQHLKTLKGATIGIVLDNAGFEVYGDLLLADWLLSTPYCNEIVFHPKDIPWFVSDNLTADIEKTLEVLASPTFFKQETGEAVADDKQKAALNTCLSRWREHFATGRFKVSLPMESDLVSTGKVSASSPMSYWTNPLSFAVIPERSPELLAELQKEGLTIFKGDLNYRKLTSDARWPHTTPFDEVLGPLRGALNILSLRTLKADVCVGLPSGTAERLDKEDPTWRVSGKYAVVAFSKAD